MSENGRILVHFSCGAASAVAAKVTIERYRKERTVEILNCALPKDEHEDNERFLRDVERWIGPWILFTGLATDGLSFSRKASDSP